MSTALKGAHCFVLYLSHVASLHDTFTENKEGAVPGTLFCNSENGWINSDVYLDWFDFFFEEHSSVALIQDGHASHVSIRASDVHILCLSAHTTHILQPLGFPLSPNHAHSISVVLSLMTG